METIYHAPSDILVSMARARSLSTEGSDDDIRKRLYDYYGYESVTVTEKRNEEDGEGKYTLTILNADTVTSSSSLVTLEGNVSADFDFPSGGKRSLTASTVLVDSASCIITAIGNAVYSDSSPDAAISRIEADILTLRWEDMDILLTGGSTTTERENSEKKKVTFHTQGERLSYLNEGAVVFDEGYITSNPKTAYSSISASSILILPGSDMFLSSATFNIGRVPIFYLPFFFFPGSRILGNPSFGFSSEKGAFVNTTFELIGSYPEIESADESSSFSSLLKSTDSSEGESVNGYYYSEKKEKSPVEKFAEDTGSYLVLMADAYKGGSGASIIRSGGVHVGLWGKFSLFSSLLNITFSSGLATPQSVLKKDMRYYLDTSLSFSKWGLTTELKFPLYSDQTVLYHFANRLTGFSYGPLLGGKSAFPSDYSSSGITTFTRLFTLSYSLPSSLKIPLVSSFSVKNLSLEGNYSISSSSGESILTSYSLPSFSVTLSGTVFSLESKEKKNVRAQQEKDSGGSGEEKKEEKKDILLPSQYTVTGKKSSGESKTAKKSKFSLSYTLTEDYANRVNRSSSTGKDKDGKIQNTFYSRVTAEGNIADFLTLSDALTSSLTYTDSEDYTSNVWARKFNAEPVNTFKATMPAAGLTYTLAFKPFTYSSEEKESEEKSVSASSFAFTSSFVKTHSLSFSKSFSTVAGTFTGDLSYILPPLDGSITPALKWSGLGASLSLSWLFKESGESYMRDLMKLVFSYSSSYATAAATLSYQTKDYSPLSFWAPFTLSSTVRVKNPDSRYYIEGKFAGEGTTEGFLSQMTLSAKLDALTSTFIFLNNDGREELDSVNITADMETKSFQMWKGRIYCAFALTGTLFLSRSDRTRSYLSLKPSLTFSLAQFIDIVFSFRTQNSRLGSYYEGDIFSFASLFDDLKRSVDFFGNGRRNTNFVLQSVSLDVVHYMEDWNLNFSYSTSFRKSTQDGKTIYTLQPSFSVYLAWNTMPDLKVEENWTKDSEGIWTRK